MPAGRTPPRRRFVSGFDARRPWLDPLPPAARQPMDAYGVPMNSSFNGFGEI